MMARSIFSSWKVVGVALSLVASVARVDAQGTPADAYIVVDSHANRVLMASNAGKKRPVASLTKIATACVVLDWAERTGTDLGQIATVPPSASQLQPNPFGFAPGDRISLRDALCCAMMGSDNIAAETLAWHVGADIQRRTGRGGSPFSLFVKEMNKLAGFLKMSDTKFLNPHGLDNASAVPYSTAADMARLTIYAQKKPAFGFYTSQRERRVTFLKRGERQSFMLKNTNVLVGVDGIDGVKTGTTSKAGQCLVLSATKKAYVQKFTPVRNNVYPRRVVTVLLGAHQDRFRDGKNLLDQGWARQAQWHANGRVVSGHSELLDPPSR